MEKVYNLTTESEYFQRLMTLYLDNVRSRYISFVSSNITLDCNELLRFAVHHAQCGENVYLVGFPRQVQVLYRPETLFFFEHWREFMDISALDHGIAIAVVNRNQYDSRGISETFRHISNNFNNFVGISIQN